MLRRIEMANTKIVVIQLKEIIYTVIFVALGILLILLLISMFKPDKKDSQDTSSLYKPGKWETAVEFSDAVINLEVVLDKDHINSVNIINLDETVTAMYPLVQPSLEKINLQLSEGIPLDEITLSEDSKFTETLLIDAIATVLEKAKATP